jgi:hypothetical protein
MMYDEIDEIGVAMIGLNAGLMQENTPLSPL